MRWNRTFVAALMVGVAQQVSAQTVTRYDFNIPAGPRSQVIQSIAQSTGSAVSFANPRDKGLSDIVGPIQGKMSESEALSRALAGSSWYVEAAGNNQVRIALSGANSSDIIVTGRRQGLKKEDSSLLTRTDTPLKDTPGTIVSVTQEVLRSQNTTSIDEATRNLPGISFIPGSPSQISSRGGSTEGASFTNGLRNSSLGGSAPTIDVEAIEVLKGPSSIITGTAVAGGLLNIVPKTATGTSPPQIDLGVGSETYLRADADVGGAISESNRLYWRVVGLAEHANRQNEGGNDPHAYSAALLLGYRDHGWKIDSETQYYDTKTVYGRLYANDDATKSVVPLSFIDNSGAYFRDRSVAQNLRVEKDLLTSEAFSLRLRFNGRYQHADEDISTISNGGVLTFPGLGTNNFVTLTGQNAKSNQLSLSTDLYAKITTGAVQQQLIAAFDFSGERLNVLTSGGAALYPLQPVPPLVDIPDSSTAGVFAQRITRNNYGAVIQDQITWGRLHALASLRRSWYTTTTDVPASQQNISMWLPSGGIVYSATDWLSIYYSYQKGLTPPQPLLRIYPGEPFPPSVTTGHEAGVKLELLDGRLSVTADYFRRSASNIALTDPLHPGFSVVGPPQKAEGFEVSEIGKLSPSLFVQSGFTYAKSSNSTPLIGAPRYTANLWLLKNFKLGDSDKLDLGFGGNWQSKTNVTELNLLTGGQTYPRLYRDYLRFDAAIGYTHGPYKLNLTVNNLFNRFNLYTPLIATNLFRATGRDVRLVFTFTPGAK